MVSSSSTQVNTEKRGRNNSSQDDKYDYRERPGYLYKRYVLDKIMKQLSYTESENEDLNGKWEKALDSLTPADVEFVRRCVLKEQQFL